jgi:hypothetical protein
MAENTTVRQRLKPHAGRLVAALGLLAIGLVAGLGLAQVPLKASSTPAGGAGQTVTTAAVSTFEGAGPSGGRWAGRVAAAEHAAWLAAHPATQNITTAAVGRGGAAEHASWLAARPATQNTTTAAVGRGGSAEHAAWLAAHPTRPGR